MKYISPSENEKVESKNQLRFPSKYRVTMLVCFLGWFPMEALCLILNIEDWPYAVLMLCAGQFPCLLAYFLWSMWKVEILKDGFIYRNYFGKKKRYYFSELELWEHPKGLKWFFKKNGKKIFCMAYYIEGGNKLHKLYYKNVKKQQEINIFGKI